MNNKSENNEFVDITQKGRPSKKSTVKEVLDGSLLTRDIFVKQLPFILFLAFLAIVYIANRYHAESIIRETSAIQNEMKDLRSEAITIASELMHISKQSEVVKLVNSKDLDLVESKDPPVIIRVNKKDK
ncbi:MAG: hypothetical protein JXB17_09420 [Bacteroidales bacterium]|nr:hypothetical protein [Bacteroidales bacterium]